LSCVQKNNNNYDDDNDDDDDDDYNNYKFAKEVSVGIVATVM